MLNPISSQFMKTVVVVLIMFTSLALSGCGKKPNSVDPPMGVSSKDFPRVYPDPATDAPTKEQVQH